MKNKLSKKNIIFADGNYESTDRYVVVARCSF